MGNAIIATATDAAIAIVVVIVSQVRALWASGFGKSYYEGKCLR